MGSDYKVFVSDEDVATFLCPSCEKMKQKSVSEYKKINLNKPIRIKCKCPCGHIHTVLLERRKFRRKLTNIPGSYIWGSHKVREPMVVKDLSLTGLKLEQKIVRQLSIGDIITVEFNLNDKQRTPIHKEAIVKNVSFAVIGCAFCSITPDDLIVLSEYADIS